MLPSISFARVSGDVSKAYQVMEDAPEAIFRFQAGGVSEEVGVILMVVDAL